MHRVYVGVGSNIEPEKHLRGAIERLELEFGLLQCSSVYQSPAFGFSGPNFLNVVVQFGHDAGPLAVAAILAAIERDFGRPIYDRRQSRPLDLDLLLYGSSVNAELRLPRVDTLRYPFVLGPLRDLAPDLRHPVTGTVIADAWQEMLRGGAQLTSIGQVTDI